MAAWDAPETRQIVEDVEQRQEKHYQTGAPLVLARLAVARPTSRMSVTSRPAWHSWCSELSPSYLG